MKFFRRVSIQSGLSANFFIYDLPVRNYYMSKNKVTLFTWKYSCLVCMEYVSITILLDLMISQVWGLFHNSISMFNFKDLKINF